MVKRYEGQITGLYIYPVKSCRGIAVDQLDLTSTGIKFDRQWMIVDDKNEFITLRTLPKLSEIKTHLSGPYLHLYAGSNKILIDHSKPCDSVETVTVWKDSFTAGVENKSINDSLSDFLSKSVKLVRYQSESFRDLGSAATSVTKQTMFADGYPVLLANENSLKDLNQRMKEKGFEPSVIERFRANIIVNGFEAYIEDEINSFYVETSSGNIELTNSKLCARCPVITQDVETGKVVSKETLKVLSEYRKMKDSNKVPFGVNLTPANLGSIQIGQKVFGV